MTGEDFALAVFAVAVAVVAVVAVVVVVVIVVVVVVVVSRKWSRMSRSKPGEGVIYEFKMSLSISSSNPIKGEISRDG